MVAYGYGGIWIWWTIDDRQPKNIDSISLWWPNQMDILRISTLLTGLRCGLLELDDHRCYQDRCRNRAALHAIGNLPPPAQPDCLRQRPIHPQQAAARAEGHLNPRRRRRAGDRPTMTPTASAKGEGRVNTRASAPCVRHPYQSHHNGKEPVGRVHRVRF
jgi:hypothetical protein